MQNVGISRKGLAEFLSEDTINKLWVAASSADAVIADELGICAKCLKGGWLEPVSGAIVKCWNCGTEWLVIEK